jgi:hypothetical protein
MEFLMGLTLQEIHTYGPERNVRLPDQLEAKYNTPPKFETPKLDTFTCFLKLPLEIRRKIWKMAACEPHLIEIWQQDEIARDLNGVTNGFIQSFAYFSPAPRNPDVLRVSRESREEALLYLKRKDPNSEPRGFGEYRLLIPKSMIEVHASSTDIFCVRGPGFNKVEVLDLFRHFRDRGISTIATDINRFAPLSEFMFARPHSKPNTIVYESWRMAQLEVVILYYHKDDMYEDGNSPNFGSLLPVCECKFGVATRENLEIGYNNLRRQERNLQNLFDDIESKVTAERTACEAKCEEYRPLSAHYGEHLPGEFKKPRIEVKGLYRKNPDPWWEAFKNNYMEYDEGMAKRDRRVLRQKRERREQQEQEEEELRGLSGKL